MEQDKKFYTLIVFSENFAGVLNQVTAVFTRRQVNIESLNVSASSIKGVHKYTITCWTTEEQIVIITKQIEKKIDVLQANYFTDDEIFIQEVALYKLATPVVIDAPQVSEEVRRHGAQIVEVNPTYTVVTKKGRTEEIMSLYHALNQWNWCCSTCVPDALPSPRAVLNIWTVSWPNVASLTRPRRNNKPTDKSWSTVR